MKPLALSFLCIADIDLVKHGHRSEVELERFAKDVEAVYDCKLDPALAPISDRLWRAGHNHSQPRRL